MLAEIAAVGGVDVDYIAFLRDGTVESTPTVDGPTTVAIAAKIGKTGLIDNTLVK